MSEIEPPRKLAMLIDGDNAQPRLIEQMIRETEKYGSITIRRIYGDWTQPQMNGWKDTLNLHAIQPIQQFRYTVGKNATDSALIIDAMDILRDDLVEGFCIVSSDCDYTRLATRIREDGLLIIGIGEKKTPEPFVKACNIFVYTEIIDISGPEVPPIKEPRPVEKALTKKEKTQAVKKTEKPDTVIKTLIDPKESIPLLKEAFRMVVQDDGWAHLANVGLAVRKIDPGFDSRAYGYQKLLYLVQVLPDVFEIKIREEIAKSAIYLRLIEDQPKPSTR